MQFRSIPAIIGVLLALSAPMVGHAAPSGSQVIGKWRLTTALAMIDITSRDEKEARQLLGHVMTIRSGGAQLDGYKCAPADFETKSVQPALYVQEYAGIDAKKLHLPDPVTVVDISCTQVFIKNPTKVVIFWDGWFFEASRVDR